MSTVIKTAIKIISIFLSFYLVFALVGSTLPYLFQKGVSESTKKKADSQDFYEDGLCSDRALLVEDTTAAFGLRIQMLREAKYTLDIAYHTIQDGEISAVFLAEVYSAAERGVVVRLIIDGKVGLFEHQVKRDLGLLAHHPNISVFSYNPVNLLTPWKWHALLHDKFIIADNKYLLLGGRNIADRYFAPSGYGGAVTNDRDVFIWHSHRGSPSVLSQVNDYMDSLCEHSDTREWIASIHVREPLPDDAATKFRETAENFEKNNSIFFEKGLDHYLYQTVTTNKVTLISNPINTGVKEPVVGYTMYKIAKRARQSVWIQTPYATGNKQLLTAMKDIGSNTLDYTVLTNSLASTPNFPAFSNYLSQRKKFVETGANIYEYQSRHSIHGKSMIVDDRLSVIGALNLDDRSLFIDTETMLVIDSKELTESLKSAMQIYLDDSLKVGGDNMYEHNGTVKETEVSLFKRIIFHIVSIFSRVFQFLI